MKIYSNRADKNVDCIRTSMRTGKDNSLHVTLNFRRTVEDQLPWKKKQAVK